MYGFVRSVREGAMVTATRRFRPRELVRLTVAISVLKMGCLYRRTANLHAHHTARFVQSKVAVTMLEITDISS